MNPKNKYVLDILVLIWILASTVTICTGKPWLMVIPGVVSCAVVVAYVIRIAMFLDDGLNPNE